MLRIQKFHAFFKRAQRLLDSLAVGGKQRFKVRAVVFNRRSLAPHIVLNIAGFQNFGILILQPFQYIRKGMPANFEPPRQTLTRKNKPGYFFAYA
jgi:hypothetical protein